MVSCQNAPPRLLRGVRGKGAEGARLRGTLAADDRVSGTVLNSIALRFVFCALRFALPLSFQIR
jgi:hypothetical protein